MNLDVVNDWLYVNGNKVTHIKNETEKVSSGKNICDYLIYHYTASTTAQSAHNNFLNPDVSASWHLTIDRDGNLYQLYDFRQIAWHAGKSSWKKPNGEVISGMNPVSIGIEMVNAGPLQYINGSYYTWSKQIVPLAHVFFDKNGNPWQSYTAPQIKTAKLVARVLALKYNIVDILGHENISPGRKRDPGPAFAPVLTEMRKGLRNQRL